LSIRSPQLGLGYEKSLGYSVTFRRFACDIFTVQRIAGMSFTSNRSPELKTLRDLLRFAVSRFNEAQLFFGHGSHDAFDEAAYLILHTLHLPLDRLEPFLDARLTAPEIENVIELIERRVNERIPAAYLTHEAWLGEHRFYVDPRVIVPRSFLAELLRDRLSPWISDPDRVRRALDFGTGSGCLAILLALAFPNATVDAADISEAALEVARRNICEYDLESRIEPIVSDLFEGISGRYDVIICNPPYVSDESIAALPPEYRHEPVAALAGGKDGLNFVRRVVERAAEHLTENGILVVEVGQHNREAMEAAYPHLELTWIATSGGDDCVFLVTHAALTAARTGEE
jgi:ribosomal protein L3 glutamine methyltransferase